MIKKYIKREKYLNYIIPYIEKDLIKVIVGQRRVGKSYLLYQLMDLIKEKKKDSNIIYINKELYEFEEIKDSKSLLEYVDKKTNKRHMKNYVFIDEIQDIEEFEKALRSLNASEKYDIYCTGSNANLLSGELATYLSGRYIEITMHSLSYNEFIQFHKLNNNDNTLLKYIKYGGLPYLIHLELNDDIVYDYLRNVYNTILLKDVVARYKIRNVSFLENLVEYIADNTGSLVSAKKISDFLKSQNIKISPNVVLNYLSFLSSSFFVYRVQRSDIQGKKIFEINDKYYFEDLGLKNSIVGYKQVDINKDLENLVFSHLKYFGYKITVGQMKEKEIDFVCEKNNKTKYIQVAYIVNEKNKEREFGNLLAIQDNYEKIVVSMDKLIDGEYEYKGVKHMNINYFLTNFS
ncbi:MAG: ATP-binding protein [Patescibacteria group bacterium]|nr:ATP-binding protein [Patescibacteria group bacterium]